MQSSKQAGARMNEETMIINRVSPGMQATMKSIMVGKHDSEQSSSLVRGWVVTRFVKGRNKKE